MMASQKMDQGVSISILFGSRKIQPTPPMPALLIPPQCPWLARKKIKLFGIMWYIIYPCLRVTGRAQVLMSKFCVGSLSGRFNSSDFARLRKSNSLVVPADHVVAGRSRQLCEQPWVALRPRAPQLQTVRSHDYKKFAYCSTIVL